MARKLIVLTALGLLVSAVTRNRGQLARTLREQRLKARLQLRHFV